jgi:hypothetical protein
LGKEEHSLVFVPNPVRHAERQMRLTLQPATLQDVETVVAFESKLADPRIYGPMLDVPGALEEIKKNTFCFLKTGDIVVGTAAYRLRADNSVYISNLAVDPGLSGSGGSPVNHVIYS